VDVIFASGDFAPKVAQQATETIPIVDRSARPSNSGDRAANAGCRTMSDRSSAGFLI
jgi:hypothetical protein